MGYRVMAGGQSRSFPASDPFLKNASKDGDVLVCIGGARVLDAGKAAIAIELDTEYLADHVGNTQSDEAKNVVGFNRYRNGEDAPSNLIELVRNTWTEDAAVEAARTTFEKAGLTVVVCSDQPGRIIDRLVAPKYNAALRFLDEGLATQEDMDKTCRMGLGYPDGLAERVIRGGLARHHDVTKALFDVFGTAAYAPPRAAVVARRRNT
jgi:3-hydroxybutyryl-CoA dehydrogenase